jgi:hypothetical protein
VASITDMYGGTLRSKRLGEPMETSGGDLENDMLPRTRLASMRPTSSPTDSLTTNPFADTYDNPFDDGNAVQGNESPSSSMYPMGEVHHHHHHQHYAPHGLSTQRQHHKQHKPSNSQSSYFSHHSNRSYDYYNNSPGMFIPMEETTSSSTAGDGMYSDPGDGNDTHGHYRSYSAESAIPVPLDRRSIISQTSTSNSCLSFDPETSLESRDVQEEEDGRSVAIHGRVGLKIPERSAAVMTAYRQRQLPHKNEATNNMHQRRFAHQHRPSKSSLHQRNTSDTSQHNAASFVELIQTEIRSYLSHADLDSTTRAQVKDHLIVVLGDRARTESLQDTINACIEATTLELLAQHSSPSHL